MAEAKNITETKELLIGVSLELSPEEAKDLENFIYNKFLCGAAYSEKQRIITNLSGIYTALRNRIFKE